MVNSADTLMLWRRDDLVAVAAIDVTGDAIRALRHAEKGSGCCKLQHED
jgi:hypothetical protein